MVTRLPADHGERVRQLAEDYDWSYSETLAALVGIGLGHQDELPAPAELPQPTQEELPLTRAS